MTPTKVPTTTIRMNPERKARLAKAAEILGTDSASATIDAALDHVLRADRARRAVTVLAELGARDDLIDRDEMWR